MKGLEISFDEDLYLGIRPKAGEVFLKIVRTCNNRCLFCPDSVYQDGHVFAFSNIERKLREGEQRGIRRLVLSGGECTIHPQFIDIVRCARGAGYTMITAITNGRMFSYRQFVRDALRAGLNDVVVKLHSSIESVHDRLVGVPGGFAQTLAGMEHLKQGGKCRLSILLFVNALNYENLPETVAFLKSAGADSVLLFNTQPFGRATENADVLSYDANSVLPYLSGALEAAKRVGLKMQVKKFPLNLLEGFEGFIEDPDDFFPELRDANRRINIFHEFAAGRGDILCRGELCGTCFRREFCNFLVSLKGSVRNGSLEALRVDTSFGPVLDEHRRHPLWLVGKDLADAGRFLDRNGLAQDRVVTIEFMEYDGDDYSRVFPRLETIIACNPTHFKRLSEIHSAECVVPVDKKNLSWVVSNGHASRLVLYLRNCERSREGDACALSLAGFLADAPGIKTYNLPPCLNPHGETVPRLNICDAIVLDPGINMEAMAHFYLKEGWYTKSLRCGVCPKDAACPGIHVSHIRTLGYGALRPMNA